MANDELMNFREGIVKLLGTGRPGTLNITDADGDVSTLVISPGVAISLHTWDAGLERVMGHPL